MMRGMRALVASETQVYIRVIPHRSSEWCMNCLIPGNRARMQCERNTRINLPDMHHGHIESAALVNRDRFHANV